MNTDATPQPSTKSVSALSRLRARFGLLAEFLLIILGALLALALDGWQEERELHERDKVVLQLVSAEISANLNALEQQSEYHRAMKQPISESVRLVTEENQFSIPDDWAGVKPILLTSTAFELAANTGVLARIPAETALVLSQAYNELRSTERGRANLALVTLQTSFRDGERYLRLLALGLDEELRGAQTLSPLLTEAKARIDLLSGLE